VWLVGVGVVQLFGLVSLMLTQRRNGRKIDRAVEQVENDHANHPYPNLRQQLDAIQDAVSVAASTATRAAEATERLERGHNETRRDIGGLREDIRQVRGDVGEARREASAGHREAAVASRRVRDLEETLTEHLSAGS
jgi:outer membrane murein-binding lipoprotein Lpp